MDAVPHKILYVEDDPMNRMLVRRILTQAGYIIVEAEDGLAAIQIAKRERPDLILMDIMLPGMDGHQVTTRLKSLPELAGTPIVAHTARTLDGARERALIAGCDGYIPKPIAVDRLPDQIAEFLKGKREEIKGSAEDKLTLQREYTQELAIELEQKVRQLESANVELRRADELKSKFIAMASHELKTPLAVIQGHMTMLQAHLGNLHVPMDDASHTSLEGIERGVERFKAIIQDMLDFIRIEGKALAIHRKPVLVKETVMGAIRSLETAVKERQLALEVEPLEGLPAILADAARLRQVFYNLLSNAIKYTPDGGRICITAQVTQDVKFAHGDRPGSSSGSFVHIVFEDTGIGIAPHELERIFDLFYEVRDTSLHSTSKTRFMGGGLGLGLPIARGLVEAHGGFLWVESEGSDETLCPGSRFHVLLPIED